MALFTKAELETLLGLADSTIGDTAYELLHDMAVGYLEAELATKLTLQENATAVYKVRWDDPWIGLPVPTVSVDSVTVDGVLMSSDDYSVVENRIYRKVGWGGSRYLSERRFEGAVSSDDIVSVSVTLDYGFATPPAELKTWGLVLASQAYKLAPNVGLQSERIDDYSVTYATGLETAMAAISLPDAVLGRLKVRYGAGADVVSFR